MNPKFSFLFAGNNGHDIYMQKKLRLGIPMLVPLNQVIEPRRQALSLSEVNDVR